MDDGMQRLAVLLNQRAAIDNQIAEVIGRPAHVGHIGEYIASQLFDIELNQRANQRATDGHFRSGPLAGKSVNIKRYTAGQSILDIASSERIADHSDYYLVLTVPKEAAPTANIVAIYLFETAELIPSLIAGGVKRGIATSIRTAMWRDAMVYPDGNLKTYALTPEQYSAITAFALATER